MKKIGEGSSKNLFLKTSSSGDTFLVCEFSDRVSVFDYGALPETIPLKGEAQARVARFFFQEFERLKIPTAFCPDQSGLSSTSIGLRAARHPKFEPLSHIESDLEFVPLEVIFRWGVPPGSSLLQREPNLKAFERFASPRIEFTTKLEPMDRVLSSQEAELLAGGKDRFKLIQQAALKSAQALHKILSTRGLEVWDGKFEFAWDTKLKHPVLVDAITPDELRVSLPGLREIPLSKELLRQWLGHTDWAFQLSQAKKQGDQNFRVTAGTPPHLGRWRLETLSKLFVSFAETCEQGSSRPLMEWAQNLGFEKPKVHVTGSGGREAALRWRLELEGCDVVLESESPDVVWVSPDADLAAGKVNQLNANRMWTFGPRSETAHLESSKIFGKEIASEAGIPTARWTRSWDEASRFENPPVVKLDRLAAGKGVLVADSFEQAKACAEQWSAQGEILFEEKLKGFEASAFFVMQSGPRGIRCVLLGTAQDFKRRFSFDEGPNTGGMGAYSPHPKLQKEDMDIFLKWAESTAKVLEKHGLSYNGVLYIGALKDEKRGWVLLEYNARLGDPETQALVMSWGESAVLRPMLGLALKSLSTEVPTEKQALCIAMVRPEYPDQPKNPKVLPPWNFSGSANIALFQSTSQTGRVAYLVGRGDTLVDAGDEVFAKLLDCPWKNILEWRTDLIP